MTNAFPQVLTHEDGRKATWFELFFDLVFVVAVAALAGALSHHYDWKGFAEFGFVFLVLWLTCHLTVIQRRPEPVADLRPLAWVERWLLRFSRVSDPAGLLSHCFRTGISSVC